MAKDKAKEELEQLENNIPKDDKILTEEESQEEYEQDHLKEFFDTDDEITEVRFD